MSIEPHASGQDLASTYSTAAATTIPAGVANLRAWAGAYAEVAQLASALIDTPFVPDSYRPQLDPRASEQERAAAREVCVATAAAAILYGGGIGFDNPIAALQNVYVVHGRPGLYADAMVAIVQNAGHELWVEDLTDSRAVVCGRRRGGREERVTITMDMARKAGWTNRNQNYAKDAQAMLYARAASRLCRRIAQAELKGFGASVEELQDGDDTAAAPLTRVVRRAALTSAQAPTPAETTQGTVADQAGPAPSGPPLPGEQAETEPPQPSLPPPQPAAPPARRARKKPTPAPDAQNNPPAPPTGPPLPGEDHPTAPAGGVTQAQLRKLHVAFNAAGTDTREDRLAYCEQVIGRHVTSSLELTKDEATQVIDHLDRGERPDEQDPPGQAEQEQS